MKLNVWFSVAGIQFWALSTPDKWQQPSWFGHAILYNPRNGKVFGFQCWEFGQM